MIKTKVTIEFADFDIKFTIESRKELDKETIELIEEIEILQIYWSDKRAKHYSMDYKLPNGLWLENIFYNNELTKATAKIMN
jgi:hypothetical protein